MPNTISIGDKVEIYRMRENGDRDNEVIYVSQMLDSVDGDKAKLSMPIQETHVVPLEAGEQFILCFYTAKGLFQCRAEITERYREEKLAVMEVRFLTELEKFQRRQFYRLECIIPMEHRIFTEEEGKLETRLSQEKFEDTKERLSCYDRLNGLQSDWKTGVITDISGGGARFNSSVRYEAGNKIKIDLSFELKQEQMDYELCANVISSIPVLNHTNLFESRVEFSEISNRQREAIIKFIFEEERKMRRREKGLI